MSAVCAKGVLTQSFDANGMPSSTEYLALDRSKTDLTTCEFVVETGSANNAWRELGNMSIENAEVIGASVALVWCIAWTFRALTSFVLSQTERNYDE